MSAQSPNRVGKRGTVVLPAPLRKKFGIEEGSFVITEATAEGILIRPAVVPVEIYTPHRKAEFLLNNAIDEADYRSARRIVSEDLELNPDTIAHQPPL
jgi:AbrB family looped-hinge helix DNA binding protein